MTISNEPLFIEYLKSVTVVEKFGENDWKCCNAVFEDIICSWFYISRYKFINCKFENCFFDNFEFSGAEFENCVFNNCIFQHVTVVDCSILNCNFIKPFSNTLLFGMTTFENVKMEKIEFQYTTFSDCLLNGFFLNEGWFHGGKFETGDFNYLFKTKARFENISFSNVLFVDQDLTESVFINGGADFMNCKLSSESFVGYLQDGKSNIDFSTIRQSEDLPIEVLKNNFGISAPDIKCILMNTMKESEFHTVFISYSFSNGEVAKELKRLLHKNGVKCFLWENDAPIGKKVKKIMIDGIRDYDRFLFIASANSLRSEACHFEIGEAREKYYKIWTDVFAPIHIDNYLFTVRKEDIPKKFAEKYWENIAELKEFNSGDFTFMKKVSDIEESEQFQKVLQSIKIKK